MREIKKETERSVKRTSHHLSHVSLYFQSRQEYKFPLFASLPSSPYLSRRRLLLLLLFTPSFPKIPGPSYFGEEQEVLPGNRGAGCRGNTSPEHLFPKQTAGERLLFVCNRMFPARSNWYFDTHMHTHARTLNTSIMTTYVEHKHPRTVHPPAKTFTS